MKKHHRSISPTQLTRFGRSLHAVILNNPALFAITYSRTPVEIVYNVVGAREAAATAIMATICGRIQRALKELELKEAPQQVSQLMASVTRVIFFQAPDFMESTRFNR